MRIRDFDLEVPHNYARSLNLVKKSIEFCFESLAAAAAVQGTCAGFYSIVYIRTEMGANPETGHACRGGVVPLKHLELRET